MIRTLKKTINRINGLYTSVLVSGCKFAVRQRYKSISIAMEGENEWRKKWSSLIKHPTVKYYRKYAGFLGPNVDIPPVEAMQLVIQPILNPSLMRVHYLDKNMFDKIYGSDVMAKTILRRINGEYFTADYDSLGTKHPVIPKVEMDGLIAKPTKDSYGGRNVLLFIRNQFGILVQVDNPSMELSVELLDKLLGQDWTLQEQLKQSPFMARFNESSVNTFRVHVYKSPITGRIDIPAICIRIGAKGHWYDNIHSGGVCVSVNPDTGVLGKMPVDVRSVPQPQYNGIDFADTEIIVPDIECLKNFARRIGKCVTHHHSLALDVMLDENNNYKLIEVNIGTIDAEMYMATGFTPFGKYTDEVIEYCSHRRSEVRMVHVIPW